MDDEERERERAEGDPGYQFWKALGEETSMFSRGICEGERSAVEQDPRDVWPVARKHGAMVLAYSTRPDDEVRKGTVLENVPHPRARGESLATELGQSAADPCY